MICRHCGAEITNNSIICPQCGESTAGSQPGNGYPPYNPYDYYNQGGQPKKSTTTPALVLAIIGIVAALLVPIGGIALGTISIILASKEKDKTSTIIAIVAIVIAIVMWIINAVILNSLMEQFFG